MHGLELPVNGHCRPREVWIGTQSCEPLLTLRTFGAGSLTANGGASPLGGGGGGRIALSIQQAGNFIGLSQAEGGQGGQQNGEPGTIWGLPMLKRAMLSGSSGGEGHCPICEFVKTVGGRLTP